MTGRMFLSVYLIRKKADKIGGDVLKIAVIDDERPARKMLIRRVKEVLPDCEVMEAESGADALRMFNEADSFDLIFVDMDLGDMEGITLAATAKKLFPAAKIIFATAYSQYAAKAYEMEIDDYILKPFDPERVHHVVKKCIGETAGGADREEEKKEIESLIVKKQETERETEEEAKNDATVFGKIPVTASRGILFLEIDQIVYAETAGHGCVVHTTSRSYEINQLLGELEKKLAYYGFFRIHKSYLVNLSFISELFAGSGNGLSVHMKGYESQELPVGREKLKTLKQLLKIS